jgi:predicted nucleic acid-binding protein
VSERARLILFDTDVLIWYFRGIETAAERIEGTPFDQRVTSSLCLMELVQGCRNKKELKDITDFVKENFARIIHCDQSISERALAFLKTYAPSHGLRTIDALIAATVAVNKALLVTANHRDFRMIENLNLVPFDPAGKSHRRH